jgi:branched-chain amino acid transport system ATP-binding protein
LTLEGVHTHIGAYHILHGVDLVVPRGELTMLLGRNGAGKTTTLRTIMGLWPASQGRITFGGEDITALNTPAIAQMNIAYVPENMGIFADLTVQENMLLAARSAPNAARMDSARLQWIFKLFPAVEKFWKHPAGKLSGGQPKQEIAERQGNVTIPRMMDRRLPTPGRRMIYQIIMDERCCVQELDSDRRMNRSSEVVRS